MKKKVTGFLSLVLLGAMVLTGCGNNKESETKEVKEEKTAQELTFATSFSNPSLDVHKEYYGWYTSIYGMSEALFKINPERKIDPLLAEGGKVDGNIWTITLKDGVKFSNGEPLTAEMAVDNIKRVAEVNSRFAYFGDFDIKAQDDKTIVIDTKKPYPTLMNDLASPELGMMDLKNTEDFDNNPICTGPFVIDEFNPEGDVSVKANDNYWGGDVKTAAVKFLYMQEDEPKLMAMENKEIDGYNSVSSAALEVYEKSPEEYNLVKLPATRLQFYILNENNLSLNVRKAINLTVDKEKIAAFLKGTVTATEGPFSSASAYGKVTGPKVDTKAAEQCLVDDGYVKNSEGFYEKDGKPLTIHIAYYAARSLDTLATLIEEQLAEIGVKSELTVEEDADTTYLKTGDFDLALYCMIADKDGDPNYFIHSTLGEDANYNVGGFKNAECQKKVEALMVEMNPEKRAQLANEIVQIAIDDYAFGYVGLFNKITVLKPGVTGFAEESPFDFYGIDASTGIN